MVQSFNTPVLKYLFRVFTQEKSLVIPHHRFKDISQLSFTKIKQAGIKGIIFDKDNTLTYPYQNTIYPPLQEAFEECRAVFGKNVVILSNSAGSSDDKEYTKAREIEGALGIHVLRHKDKKPDGVQSVIDYFKCSPTELVTIGDRYFTDVLFGNLHGMLTVYTKPFTNEGDNPVVKVLRPLEQQIVERWIKQHALPPHHRLASADIHAA